MRVLFACHRLPFPPKRGGKIRPFNIIRHLSEQGHEVTVGSLARSDEEREEGRDLRNYCKQVHVGQIGKFGAVAQMIARLPSRSPSSMGFFYSPELHRKMQAEISQQAFDLIFVHCSSAAQYVRTAKGVPSILDFGDMDSQKWLDYSTFKPRPLAYGYWLEGKKLYGEEKRLAAQFTTSTCTTRAELDTLNELGTARATGWFPNGVDDKMFSPGNEPYDPDGICFIGRMDYFPNQQGIIKFCDEVLPLLQSRRPETHLTIIGASPSRDVLKLAERAGVTVTGTVDDVRPYVRRAALSVAPLEIARGTQNKILESMSMGVPVVSSVIAARGVDAISRRHILAAADPEEFASHVLRLLESRDEREKLAVAGRQRVLSNHNWASSMDVLDSIIEKTLGK